MLLIGLFNAVLSSWTNIFLLLPLSRGEGLRPAPTQSRQGGDGGHRRALVSWPPLDPHPSPPPASRGRERSTAIQGHSCPALWHQAMSRCAVSSRIRTASSGLVGGSRITIACAPASS